MNRVDLQARVKALAQQIREELKQVDGQVVASENDWNPMSVKFSVVENGVVTIFTINIWEDSL